MRSALNESWMDCDGGESGDKYINGEQAIGGGDASDDENGAVNNAPEGDASAPEAEREPNVEGHLEDADFDNGEFSALNSALDQIQGALDNLESRNDGIHQELLQLLQSNREIRTNLREENGRASDPTESADEAVAGSSQSIRCLANDLLSDLPSVAKLDLGGPPSDPRPNVNDPVPSTSRESLISAASAQGVLPDLIPTPASAGTSIQPH